MALFLQGNLDESLMLKVDRCTGREDLGPEED